MTVIGYSVGGEMNTLKSSQSGGHVLHLPSDASQRATPEQVRTVQRIAERLTRAQAQMIIDRYAGPFLQYWETIFPGCGLTVKDVLKSYYADPGEFALIQGGRSLCLQSQLVRSFFWIADFAGAVYAGVSQYASCRDQIVVLSDHLERELRGTIEESWLKMQMSIPFSQAWDFDPLGASEEYIAYRRSICDEGASFVQFSRRWSICEAIASETQSGDELTRVLLRNYQVLARCHVLATIVGLDDIAIGLHHLMEVYHSGYPIVGFTPQGQVLLLVKGESSPEPEETISPDED